MDPGAVRRRPALLPPQLDRDNEGVACE
ncbi:hypothetical protein GS491_23970 [Rhodococcus hoagii]|nr:hypothetical protein [Prescottella equi]